MSKWTDDLEKLTQAEFDAHFGARDLRIAFVGMSNAGKTYRSRILHNELDFFWLSVDIEIQKLLGFADMETISDWIGYPSAEGFADREAQYLEAEEGCTILDSLDTHGKNLVFDTTGSVIYLSQATLDWLHHECLIVHIDVGEANLERLLTKFFEEPKPVVWHGMYQEEPGESEENALRRCYPKLLESRLKEYRNIAQLNIPHTELRDISAEETLAVIKSYLPE